MRESHLPSRVTGEQVIEQSQTKLALDKQFIARFKPTAEPSVLNLERFKGSGTVLNVTYFNNGQDGQRIIVLGDGTTTIVHDPARIVTNTGANKLLDADKVYRFTKFDGVWYEDEGGSGGGGGGGFALAMETTYASAVDAHTVNNTWEDIRNEALSGPLQVNITTNVDGKLFCEFTFTSASPSANWDNKQFRFVLDGLTNSEAWLEARPANPILATQQWLYSIHTVFEGVPSGAHTVKVQWHDNGSSQDQTFYGRRLTVFAAANPSGVTTEPLAEIYTTGILTDAVVVNPRPTVNTDFPGLRLTIPASNVARTFIVSGYVWTTLAVAANNNVRASVELDTTRVWTGGGGNSISFMQIFPLAQTNEGSGRAMVLPSIILVVPGDGLPHDISWRYNAVGTTASITYQDRFLTAVRVL